MRRLNETILSTSEAAEAIGVSSQTIRRAVDAKEIPGYRIPNSKHRLIDKAVFTAYCIRNKIPCNFKKK